jgi:hypothetical protein
MKLKPILPLLSSAILLFNLSTARADDFWADRLDFRPSAATFSDKELSLDLFGFSASRDRNGSDRQAWGAGAAGNYFFTQNLGVGAETYGDAFNKPYLLNALGEFRYPIQSLSLAPYAILGIGRQWTYAPQWLGHFGGGLEYRFNAKTGVFADARRVFAVNTSDYTLIRFGFRIVF